MAMMETRFEKAQDAPYRANAAVRGGRLVRVVAAGDTPATPRVAETSADDGSQFSVGGALADKTANQNVTVVHRGWMKLMAAAAVVVGEYVYPASAGRVRGAAGPGAVALAAGARPFGIALSPQGTVDGTLWVKPLDS